MIVTSFRKQGAETKPEVELFNWLAWFENSSTGFSHDVIVTKIGLLASIHLSGRRGFILLT